MFLKVQKTEMIRFIFTLIFKLTVITLLTLSLAGCAGGMVRAFPEMLKNLQQSLQPIWQFLIALSYVIGLSFMVMGVMKLKSYGQQTVMMSTHASMGPALASFIVGTGLLFLPALLDIMTVSLWGYGIDTIEGPDQSASFSDIMVPIVQLIQVFGLIAFIRGWIILSKLGSQSQPGTLSKGLMHILGGVLGINIMGTIEILGRTLGIGT